MADYTLLQAQQDVASLRGQIAHLLATAEIINVQVDGALVVQNAAAIVQPGSSPAVAETWHDMPAMSNSWAAGAGQAKYKMTVDGLLAVSFILLTPGTKTDNITLWAAGSLPSAYRPSLTKRMPVSTGTAANSANNTAALLFNSDGSVTATGINTAGTLSLLHCVGVLPLI